MSSSAIAAGGIGAAGGIAAAGGLGQGQVAAGDRAAGAGTEQRQQTRQDRQTARPESQAQRQDTRQERQTQRPEERTARQDTRQQTRESRPEERSARQGERQQQTTNRQSQRQDFAKDVQNNAWDNREDFFDDNMSGWGGYGWGGDNWWGPMAWTGVSSFVGGMAGAAIGGAWDDDDAVSYDYGGGGGYSEGATETVYESGDTITVNGQEEPVEEYAQEAVDIAQNYEERAAQAPLPAEAPAGAEAPAAGEAAAPTEADWMPLGIYVLGNELTDKDKTPTRFIQLAINKAGAIGGTYHDKTTGKSLPIQGAVDQASQRAAWYIGDEKTVLETGIYNLTQSETPVLVHHGTERTEQLTLVRIQDPAAATAPTAPAPDAPATAPAPAPAPTPEPAPAQ